MRHSYRPITPEQYDAAVARSPFSCPLHAMGDLRTGAQLLADFEADSAVSLGAPALSRELEGVAAAFRAQRASFLRHSRALESAATLHTLFAGDRPPTPPAAALPPCPLHRSDVASYPHGRLEEGAWVGSHCGGPKPAQRRRIEGLIGFGGEAAEYGTAGGKVEAVGGSASRAGEMEGCKGGGDAGGARCSAHKGRDTGPGGWWVLGCGGAELVEEGGQLEFGLATSPSDEEAPAPAAAAAVLEAGDWPADIASVAVAGGPAGDPFHDDFEWAG